MKLLIAAVTAVLLVVVGADRTPVELERYFLESCYEVLLDDNTCMQGWIAFMNSFANRDPTTMSAGDYAAYYEVIPVPERITDELLLWERTENLVGTLARQNVNAMSSFTIAPSRIVNIMISTFNVTTWCGRLNGGIDYNNSCPEYVLGTPVYTFWQDFSLRDGKSGAGVVFYLANRGFYNDGTFFGLYEFPGLLNSTSLSTRFVTLNVVPSGQSSQCGQGDLVELENRIRSERPELQYVCYNVDGDADNITQPLVDELVKIIEEEQQRSAASGVGEYSDFRHSVQ